MLLVLGRHDATLGGLLDREADPSTLKVQVDDLHPEFLTWGDDLFGQLDVVGGHLRDVHEALDSIAHLHEGSERDQLRDPAVDQFAHLVGAGEFPPRILLGGFQGEADPFPAEIHLQHLHLDLVVNADDRTGMVDVLPGEFRDVDQTVHATQVHEGAEVDHAGHDALADLARTEVVEELLPLLLLGLLQPRPAGQDHVVAVLVQLDDLGVDGGADEGLQVTDASQVHEGCGQEAPEADVNDETTLDNLDDGSGDDPVALLDLLDPAPRTLVLGTLLGEDQTAVLVLALKHDRFDLLAEGHDLAGIHAVADRQFARGDHALRLVANVEEYLVLVDPDDRALYELAVLDVDHGGRVGLLQGQRAEVVLGDRSGDVLAVLVECPHWRGCEDGCCQGGVGHVFFSSDGSWWTGIVRERGITRIGPGEPTGGPLLQRPEPPWGRTTRQSATTGPEPGPS